MFFYDEDPTPPPEDTTPPVISGDSSPSINEGTQTVGTYSANESVTWSLSGTDSSFFSISVGGVLSFNSAPAYDTPQDSGGDNVYDVNVIATDTSPNLNSASLAVAVTVLDATAPVITGSSSPSIVEGTTAVGTYTADEAVTWSLSGVDSSLLQISSSGELSFISAPSYASPGDSGGNNVYDVNVIATDTSPNANSSSLAVAITVSELQPIVTASLDLYLDASETGSYPGTGTTWYDISGNGNDATIYQGATFNTGSGGYFFFDDVNDYVSTNGNIGISGDASVTLSLWLRTTVSGVAWNNALTFGNPYVARAGMAIFVSPAAGGAGSIGAGFFMGVIAPTAAGVLSNQTWHHVTFTKEAGAINSSTTKIYVDGVSKTLNFAAASGTPNFTDTPVYLGKDTANQMFGGDIGSGFVYTKALSAAEVLQNFNATRSRFGV
jgi:hypothetical protein